MSERTPRLGAPYIRAAQAQKEVTHNAALNILDALVQAVVEDRDLTTPPASPEDGSLWIVASGAGGDWAGHDGELAQWIGGAWAFHAPQEGYGVWLKDEGVEARFDGTDWIAAMPASAIPDVSGGATVDAEARAALNALLAACRARGIIAS